MELEQLLTYLDQLYTRRAPAPLPTYSERLLKPFYHPYLEDRGIPRATQERFKVGWDPESDRIVLPHFWKGRLVGWQTRALPQPYWSKQPEEVLPKYLSSADFPKDTTIFNYAPGPAGLAVESMMSVLKHAHAFEMVATFGASITEDQADRLTKYGEITLWLDNDKAGWSCLEGTPRTKQAEAKPGLAEVLSRSVPVWIVESPWSQDPGDLPTEEAHRLATTSRVPWSVWRRPEVLYCWECRNRAHTGPCRP
jgi:DNA primase